MDSGCIRYACSSRDVSHLLPQRPRPLGGPAVAHRSGLTAGSAPLLACCGLSSMTVTFCGPAFWHQWAQADPLGRPPPQAATGTCRQPTARSCGVASKSHILLGLSPLCCLSAAWRCEQLSAVASASLFGSQTLPPLWRRGVATSPLLSHRLLSRRREPRLALRLLEPRLVCRLVGGVAWRAAVSAAASSEPRLALRLLEPRLVCRLVGGVAGGRLSLPPPRVLLVSLFVYSSHVSCAALWAAWRGRRLSLPPP